MLFLLVSLYEFGQFLRLLLWISLPLVIICVAVVSYLHYRRKQQAELENLPGESGSAADALIEPGQTPPAGEKPYQGLLWLRKKYEEDIEKADNRYYELREEFKKLEKNYIDLRVKAISLEQQLHLVANGLPSDTRSELDLLNEKLAGETAKVKDLETRLASNSQLLMKMYKELAGSLESANSLSRNRAQQTRVKGLVREFDDSLGGSEAPAITPSIGEDGQLEQLG